MQPMIRVHGDKLTPEEQDNLTRDRTAAFGKLAQEDGQFRQNEIDLTERVAPYTDQSHDQSHDPYQQSNEIPGRMEIYNLNLKGTVDANDPGDFDGIFHVNLTDLIDTGRGTLYECPPGSEGDTFILSHIVKKFTINPFPFPVHVECCIGNSSVTMGLTMVARRTGDKGTTMTKKCLFMMHPESEDTTEKTVYQAPALAYSNTLIRYSALTSINFDDDLNVLVRSGNDCHYHTPDYTKPCVLVDLLWNNPEFGIGFFPSFTQGSAEKDDLKKTKAVLGMAGDGLPNLVNAIRPLQDKVKLLRLARENNHTLVITFTPDTSRAHAIINSGVCRRNAEKRMDAWADALRPPPPEAALSEDAPSAENKPLPDKTVYHMTADIEIELKFQSM